MRLTIQQQAVVEATEPYLLISSGPGSGKSRVLIERIKWLIQNGVSPSRIVAISYTCAASGVLQERLGDVKLGCNSTLHAWLLSLLTTHGHMIGLPNHLSVIDEEEQAALLAESLEETAYRGSLKAVQAAVAEGPQARLNPMTAPQIAAEAFFQRLKADGILTYDMILFHGEHLLRRVKGVTAGIEHLLCDESQDWAEIDWRILDATGIPNIFYVGDFDQRIMSFRGACGEFEKRCKMAQ